MLKISAGMMELADVLDSKSSGSDTVRVRPPLPAPNKKSDFEKSDFLFVLFIIPSFIFSLFIMLFNLLTL